MRYNSVAAALTIGFFAAGAAAQVVEDWSSGTDINWFRVDFLTNPPGPLPLGGTSFTVAGGEYTMASNQALPAIPASLGASSVFLPSILTPDFAQGAVRTVVRLNNDHTDAFLLARGSLTLGNYYNLIFGTGSTGTELVINRFANFLDSTRLGSVDLGVIQPDQNYNVEFGFIGSSLTGKVWAVGDPEPAAPQLSVMDATYADGGFGLGVASQAGNAGFISATYGPVSFIPSPSMLGALSIGGVLALRRRRA